MNVAQPNDILTDMLDVLCPLHVMVNATGHVVHHGPTLAKIFGKTDLVGQRFLELFELKRPRLGPNMSDLLKAEGQRLHFTLRHATRAEMKGVLVPLPDNEGQPVTGGALINLSFGISVIKAVRHFDLSDADFAITDLTTELLYLVEAKSAATQALRKLNARLHGAKMAAEERAFTDSLTGLRNRRALNKFVTHLIENKDDFALVQLDLDYFKTVNDTLGHAAGDHVLREVAQILREETRATDTIIRAGGDEFILLLAPIKDPRELEKIAARLIRKLELPIDYNGHVCRISASIGSALSRSYEAPCLDRMMDDADIALYAAKTAGRGRYLPFSKAIASG